MKKLLVTFCLLIGVVYSANNNKINPNSNYNSQYGVVYGSASLPAGRLTCQYVESSLFGGKITNNKDLHSYFELMQNCMNGRTHGGSTYFSNCNNDCKYELQYFKNINQLKETAVYNCNAFNQLVKDDYENKVATIKSQSEHNNNLYQNQLSEYNRKYAIELALIKRLAKEDMDSCMNGELVNGFGVEIQASQCQYSSPLYTRGTTIPRYDYNNGTKLAQVYYNKPKPTMNITGLDEPKYLSCSFDDYHG